MKTYFSVLAGSFLITAQLMAATFVPVKHFSNSDLENLSNEISKIILDSKVTQVMTVSATANQVSKMSFTRKTTEKDLNTIKQFNTKYMGQLADDEMGVTAENIVLQNKEDQCSKKDLSIVREKIEFIIKCWSYVL